MAFFVNALNLAAAQVMQIARIAVQFVTGLAAQSPCTVEIRGCFRVDVVVWVGWSLV